MKKERALARAVVVAVIFACQLYPSAQAQSGEAPTKAQSAPQVKSEPAASLGASAAKAEKITSPSASAIKVAKTDGIDCRIDETKCSEVPTGLKMGAVIGALAILLLGVGILTGFNFTQYLLGMDCRYSKSKFQIALWFGVLIWSYLAFTIVRLYEFGLSHIGGIGITENLLLLSGLSALTYGGAKAITTSKVDAAKDKDAAATATAVANNVAPPSPTPTKVSADIGKASFPKDLVTDDAGKPDFGDLQMIVIVILAVTIYIIHVIADLSLISPALTIELPDVDSTLLGMFGVGQGAYLIKKFAGTPGNS